MLAIVPIAAATGCWVMGGERKTWALGAVGLLTLATLLHVAAYDSLQDDAFISFRYARNLVEGHGLVFNVGERVEGYSNFLLVALLAIANGIFGLDIVVAALVFGVLFSAGTVILGYCLARELAGGCHATGLIAATCLAGSGAFAAYGRSGLETPMFCFLVVASLYLATRRGLIHASLIAGLATMTRPEGCVLFVAITAVAILARGPRIRNLTVVSMAYGATILPWTLWRFAYYGYLVPNQVNAKWGMDLDYQLALGLAYLGASAIIHWPYLILAAIALGAVCYHRSFGRITSHDALLGLAFLGATAFPVAAGGDWMPASRLLVPAVVLGCIVVARTWHLGFESGSLRPASRLTALAVAVAAGTTLVLGTRHPAALDRIVELRAMVRTEVEIGSWLKRSLPADTQMAAFANGAIPYYSELHTIDLLGLTDEHISRRGKRLRRGLPGHIAHDFDYVIARSPAIVTFLDGDGLSSKPNWEILKKFSRYYVPVPYEFSKQADRAVYANLWIRKSEVPRLAPLLVDAQAGIQRVPVSQKLKRSK